MKVYFLSGMCVNCKVFNEIKLPAGYEKHYIEWQIPEENETLDEYTHAMAKEIDISQAFILIGYSLGGIIMQEMNKFLKPEINILISSMKSEEEIPPLFRIARKTRIIKHVPKRLYAVNKSISNLFTHLVYDMPIDHIEECVTYTSPEYMKWTTYQITNWKPTIEINNLYHIHGTKDQVFPYRQIQNVYTIEDGDHLMVMKKAEEVNKIINEIILKRG
jgi:thioesterase domain-containing protein